MDVLERHLTALPDNPSAEVSAALNDSDEDVRQPIRQEWGILSEEAAPRLARGSYVVALYAAYESGITELAASLQRRVGEGLALQDIRGGTFIDRARKYFDIVLQIPLCPDEAQWSTIVELALVRHASAHANGRVIGLSSKGKRILNAMQQRGDAREYWGSIAIEAPYLRRALQAVDTCMRDLIERTRAPRLGPGSS